MQNLLCIKKSLASWTMSRSFKSVFFFVSLSITRRTLLLVFLFMFSKAFNTVGSLRSKKAQSMALLFSIKKASWAVQLSRGQNKTTGVVLVFSMGICSDEAESAIIRPVISVILLSGTRIPSCIKNAAITNMMIAVSRAKRPLLILLSMTGRRNPGFYKGVVLFKILFSSSTLFIKLYRVS